MPELSPKTGALREAVLAGELSGRDLLIEKREFHLKAEQPGEWTDAATGRHYEVVGREADGDLVTFFVRAWTASDKKTQLAFGRPGKAVGIERFRFQNIPTLTEDPLGGFEECGTDPETGLIQTRPKLIEDPLLVARELIRQQVGLTARIDAGADFKATGRTVTTFYPEAGSSGTALDGSINIGGADGVWATVRARTPASLDATGTTGVSRILATTTSNQYAAGNWNRSLCCFDSSALGSGATITDASSSVYGFSTKTNTLSAGDFTICQSNASNPGSLTTSDFDDSAFGSTLFGSITNASYSTSGYNDITLNASGISAISKTGVTKLGYLVGGDFSNTEPTWVSGARTQYLYHLADQTGTTNDPKLTVTHEAAAAGGSLLMAAAGG